MGKIGVGVLTHFNVQSDEILFENSENFEIMVRVKGSEQWDELEH